MYAARAVPAKAVELNDLEIVAALVAAAFRLMFCLWPIAADD